MDLDDRRARFRTLHEEGAFLMPNPFDLGSCRLLDVLGFPALATTSGGFAASRGRKDMTVGREELVEHVTSLRSVTDLPVNVDAEQCFPERNGGWPPRSGCSPVRVHRGAPSKIGVRSEG